jgi:hypothetical protein
LRRITAILLLGLFLGFYGATTLFYHSHWVDGMTIHHSHPYTGMPEDHSHTRNDLILIDLISGAGYVILIALFISGLYYILKIKRDFRLVWNANSGILHYSFHLRAPPHFA